jgi:hypothetical protein
MFIFPIYVLYRGVSYRITIPIDDGLGHRERGARSRGERNFSSTSRGPLSIVNGHTLSDDNFLNETQI